MKVTISKASEMVGVTRATFYRHIEKRGISVEKDEDGNPKVDVAELIRIYGDKVKTLEDLEAEKRLENAKEDIIKRTKLSKAESDRKNTDERFEYKTKVELEVLREKLRGLEDEKKQSHQERERERKIMQEQIESLRDALESSQDQQKRLTLMLTDQRDEKGTADGRSRADDEERIEDLKETIELLRKQNGAIIRKIKQQEEEQNSKAFWQKLFG